MRFVKRESNEPSLAYRVNMVAALWGGYSSVEAADLPQLNAGLLGLSLSSVSSSV